MVTLAGEDPVASTLVATIRAGDLEGLARLLGEQPGLAAARIAFLLERLGRLQEAAAARQDIIDWCEERDAPLMAQWPKRELARLRTRHPDG
jgi:hypothetical protein